VRLKVGAPKLIQGGLEAAAKGDAAYEAAATAISQTMLGLAQKGLSVPNNLLAKQFPDLVKLTEAAKMKTDMGQALQWLTQYRGLTPTQMEATVKAAGNAAAAPRRAADRTQGDRRSHPSGEGHLALSRECYGQ
jgi:hypothetical protein